MFVPPVEWLPSGWRVDGVTSGCLIGLTKVKHVQMRSHWLTITAGKDQVFEMGMKELSELSILIESSLTSL